MKNKFLLFIAGLLVFLLQAQTQELEEIAKTLPPPDNQGGYERYYYGYSVSVSGDYAVVGSQGYADFRGSAYVLHFTGNSWDVLAILTASDGSFHDSFGRSVSISGNYVVVGVDSDEGCPNVYLFEKPTTGWKDATETAKLTTVVNEDYDDFGCSVSVSGDYVVVGAPKGDYIDSHIGKVYLYEKPATGWKDTTESAKFTASDGGEYDNFGYSVSVSGNYVVVGNNKGSAYLFEKPATGWKDTTQTAKFTASDGVVDDNFGYSVSVSGNYAVVGAIGDDNKGSAYLYEKPATGWKDTTQTAKFTASDRAEEDKFGYSVSISDDYVVVGAVEDDDKGSCYLFEKPSSGWKDDTQTVKFIASDGAEEDDFGCSVSISGDYVVVGAYGDDDKYSNSGAAYFYRIYNPITFIEETQNMLNICSAATASFSIQAENADNYQWQVSSDDGINYSDISDNAIYTGSQSNTLSVITDWSLDSTLYRCILSNKVYSDTSISSLLTMDTENPVITSIYLDQTLDAGANCEAILPDYTVDIITSDNCDNELTIQQLPVAGTAISGSTNPVRITATDEAGNEAEALFNVTVKDTISPSIVCLENQTVNLEQGQTFYTIQGEEFDFLEADDNCELANIKNDMNNMSSLDGAKLAIGTTKITWCASDISGNLNLCSTEITVNNFTSGTNELSQSGILIYPNPTEGLLNLEFKENSIQKIKINDLTGNIIFEKTTSIVQHETIDLSAFVKGVYVVVVQLDNKIISSVIVKE